MGADEDIIKCYIIYTQIQFPVIPKELSNRFETQTHHYSLNSDYSKFTAMVIQETSTLFEK